MPAGATAQLDTTTDYREGMPGQLVSPTPIGACHWLINTDPQAVEVWTLTIDTATDSETYGVLMTSPISETVEFTAGVATTATLIAAGLVSQWNSFHPPARGFAKAANAAGVITFTGEHVGIPFDLAEGANAAKMTLVNTTDAGEADPVPFGRGMVITGANAGTHDRTGVLAQASALDVRVSTLAVTYVVGETYTVSLTVDGQTYTTGPVPANTDSATTASDLNTALNAVLPANTVLATVVDDDITLTAEVPGRYFEVSVATGSSTPGNLVLADTTNTPLCDINRVFGGIALRTTQVAARQVDVDASEWPPNFGVEALVRHGTIWVASDESPAFRSEVYMETGVAADNGKFFATGSATRLRLDPRIATWDIVSGSSSDAAVAAIRLA